MDCGNGLYIVKTLNFGKERYGLLYQSFPYRMGGSDDIFWYDIAIYTIMDFTYRLGVHYMSYGEIVNRCRSYYENEWV